MYPEKTKDRNTCKRIIDVFRNHNNDKSIAVKDSSSESSEEELMTQEELKLRKAEDKVQSRNDAISDSSSDSERTSVLRQSERHLGAQGIISMAEQNESDSDDEVDEKKENKQLDDNISQEGSDCEVDEVGMGKNPAVVANVPMDIPEENDPIVATSSTSSSDTEDEEVDEVVQKKESEEIPNEPIRADKSDSDEEVDKVDKKESEEIPNEPIRADKSDSDEEVDEMGKKKESEEIPNESIRTPNSDSISKSDLDVPPLPLPLLESEPEPEPEPESMGPAPMSLPEPEPEIITVSNNPAGYDRNNVETEEEREERRRKRREARDAAKKQQIEDMTFIPPSIANPAPLSEPTSSSLINIAQPGRDDECEWMWTLIMYSPRNQVVHRGIACSSDVIVYCWLHHVWNLVDQSEVIRCIPYCYCVIVCLFTTPFEMKGMKGNHFGYDL